MDELKVTRNRKKITKDVKSTRAPACSCQCPTGPGNMKEGSRQSLFDHYHQDPPIHSCICKCGTDTSRNNSAYSVYH